MPAQRNTVLEALLVEYGYSHQQLADEINDAAILLGQPVSCTDRHVRRWISGEVAWPWRRYLLPLREVFSRAPEELGFVPRGATSARLPVRHAPTRLPPHDPEDAMQRRTLIAASATATLATALRIDDTPSQGRLGMSDVQRVENAINRLHAQFHAVGGGPLLDVSLAYLDRLRQAIDRCTYGPRVEQALYRQVSSLYSSAGWHALDSARQPQAAALFNAALQSALLSADPLSQARAWGNLAVQARNENRHREAIRFARIGLEQPRSRKDPRITALLYSRLAIGQAQTREPGMGRSLLDAERAYDRVDSPPEPWLAFLGPCEISGLAGIAHQTSGHYKQAERSVTQALGLMPPSLRRNKALYTVRLAEIQLRQGRRDDARATLTNVKTAVATGNQLITERLAAVNRTLGARV